MSFGVATGWFNSLSLFKLIWSCWGLGLTACDMSETIASKSPSSLWLPKHNPSFPRTGWCLGATGERMGNMPKGARKAPAQHSSTTVTLGRCTLVEAGLGGYCGYCSTNAAWDSCVVCCPGHLELQGCDGINKWPLSGIQSWTHHLQWKPEQRGVSFQQTTATTTKN